MVFLTIGAHLLVKGNGACYILWLFAVQTQPFPIAMERASHARRFDQWATWVMRVEPVATIYPRETDFQQRPAVIHPRAPRWFLAVPFVLANTNPLHRPRKFRPARGLPPNKLADGVCNRGDFVIACAMPAGKPWLVCGSPNVSGDVPKWSVAVTNPVPRIVVQVSPVAGTNDRDVADSFQPVQVLIHVGRLPSRVGKYRRRRPGRENALAGHQ